MSWFLRLDGERPVYPTFRGAGQRCLRLSRTVLGGLAMSFALCSAGLASDPGDIHRSIATGRHAAMAEFLEGAGTRARQADRDTLCAVVTTACSPESDIFRLDDFTGVYVVVERSGPNIGSIAIATLFILYDTITLSQKTMAVTLDKSTTIIDGPCEQDTVSSVMTLRIVDDHPIGGFKNELEAQTKFPECEGGSGSSFVEGPESAAGARSQSVLVRQYVTYTEIYP